MKFSYSVLIAGLLIFLGNKSIAPPSNNKGLPEFSLVCPFEHGAGREPKEAFTYSKRSLELAKELSFPGKMKEAAATLKTVFQKQNKYKTTTLLRKNKYIDKYNRS